MTAHALPYYLAATAMFWLVLPLCSLFSKKSTNNRLWSVFVLLGAISLGCVSAIAFCHGPCTMTLPVPISLGQARFEMRFDPLAALMLGLIAFTSAAGSPYISGYMSHYAKKIDMRLFWTAYSGLLASMTLVCLAGNALTFLVVWELMSLTSFFLVATDHENEKTRYAALVYLAATRLGTALIAGGFIWAHSLTHTWEFSAWHLVGVPAFGAGLLVLAGLGVKSGMWPFHLWLPIAHPAAPAPVSAVMSGVMVKVAIITIIRLFIVHPAFTNTAFGYTLMLLGAVGTAWGILFALVQQDLKRMLALSTVENVGLILLAVGGGIVATHLKLHFVADLVLAAALLHIINHATFKSLLFLSSGAVDHSAGSRDLNLLGGIARRMPTTYACFLVGAASICALPPFCGFASEWLMYQSAFYASWMSGTPLIRFCGLLAITCLALIGSLVAACFIKTIGVVFQGRARSPAAENASDVTSGMRTSQILLAIGCCVLGFAAPLLLRLFQAIVDPYPTRTPLLVSAWTVPLWPAATVLLLTAAIAGIGLARSRALAPSRKFITWDCGFGDVGPRVQVSSISFALPVVRMFGTLFNYAQTMRFEGLDPRLFPLEITAEASVDHPLEHHVYGPAVRWFGHLSDKIVNLQHGSIHRYLLTMLVTLALLLVIGVLLR